MIRIYDFKVDPGNDGISLVYTFLLFLFFLMIYLVARNGKTQISAWLLIISYAITTIFCFYVWGADLPAALLMTVLIVMMAGIFLGDKEAFIISLIFSLVIIMLSYWQEKNIIAISSNWRLEPHELIDGFVYVFIISIIFLLAWITSRENHQALIASENSKLLLQKERDNLEATVHKRTKEILKIKKEKMEQLQILAGIGRLSGGIFHDIVNPLTVVNLNLEQIKDDSSSSVHINKAHVQQAISAADRIKDLIDTTNNCLGQKNKKSYFSPYHEIKQIQRIMEAKARSYNIELETILDSERNLCGSKPKFGQIIMNLISNAIDASANIKNASKIKVVIKNDFKNKKLIVSVSDQGEGISKENITKIFRPFFSTKKQNDKNVGLGLSVVKEIVEQDFKGKIEVFSEKNKGSTFVVKLPI